MYPIVPAQCSTEMDSLLTAGRHYNRKLGHSLSERQQGFGFFLIFHAFLSIICIELRVGPEM